MVQINWGSCVLWPGYDTSWMRHFNLNYITRTLDDGIVGQNGWVLDAGVLPPYIHTYQPANLPSAGCNQIRAAFSCSHYCQNRFIDRKLDASWRSWNYGITTPFHPANLRVHIHPHSPVCAHGSISCRANDSALLPSSNSRIFQIGDQLSRYLCCEQHMFQDQCSADPKTNLILCMCKIKRPEL